MRAWPAYKSEDAKTKPEDELYARLVKSPTTLSPADWQAVREAVADAAPRLRAIHSALGKPICVFHHDYQTTHPEMILLPELAQLRSYARLLSMESLLMAHDSSDNGAAAVANARLGFRLADDANSDSLLISYLVAVAIDHITANTMQKILLLNPNSAATANAVLASLKDAPRRSLKPTLGGESAFGQTTCEMVRQDGFAGVQKLAASAREDGETSRSPMTPLLAAIIALRRPHWNQIIDKNALAMLRLNRDVIAVCDQPYRESQPIVTRAQASLLSSRNPEDFLTAILLPVETKLLGKRAGEENKISVTQAAAAILAYRATHGGTLPATLKAAMPAPPTNAFDGTPLAYTTTQAGFTVGALDPADPTNKSSISVFAFPEKD